MPMPRGYLVFGTLVLAAAALLEFRGVGLGAGRDTRADPRSIRNNPGSYRSTYYGGRTTYGK
ncbi:MAG: hypothetical protein HY275_08130 [Gemmatimonadetes bacterium]|nr:hypothetical protein [Gemmatimonadota bacterium]